MANPPGSTSTTTTAPSGPSTSTTTSENPPTTATTTPPPTGPPVPGTTSSSSSAAGGSSSSSSSSLTTSSTTSTSSAPPTTAPVVVASPTTHVETLSGGSVVTLTSVVQVTPSTLPSSAASAPVPFFHNKPAVIGTFAAAGLVALIVLTIFGTSYLRRRRARAFDYEVEQQAAEAAKAGAYEDDYDPSSTAVHGYGQGPKSDTTHGTYSQTPMSHEAYGMRQLPHNGGGYEAYEGGAAGVGTGSAAVTRQKSSRDPYHAFAAPTDPFQPGPPLPPSQQQFNQQQQYAQHPYSQQPAYATAQGDRGADLLAAAGLGEHQAGAGAFNRRSATAAVLERGLSIARSPSQQPLITTPGLGRNRSITLEHMGYTAEQGYVGGSGQSPPPQMPQAQQQYMGQGRQQQQQYYDGGAGGYNRSSSVYEEDAYGGYEDAQHQPPPQHAQVQQQGYQAEAYQPHPTQYHEAYQQATAVSPVSPDFADYGGQRRLRVANE